MEMLPKIPQWKSKQMSFPGYPTKVPIVLYYRDSLDCMEHLFGNPLFADKIDFQPRKIFETAEKLVRIYSEWMTGDGAWELQARSTYLLQFYSS